MRNDVTNIWQARDKEKLSSLRQELNLPYAGRMLQPLSYEGLVASWAICKVHICHESCMLQEISIFREFLILTQTQTFEF